jgi:adhesin/invasin
VPDAAGNLYIGSLTLVRKVTPGGGIGPYAGNGQWSFSGDGGPATAASLAGASGLAVDSANNLYIVDSGNRRIRQVQPAASPAMALSSTYVTFSLAAAGSAATTQTFVLSNGSQGTLNWAASPTTTTGGAWLSVSPSTGSILAGQAGTKLTVTANPSGLAPGDYYGQIQVTSPNAASPVQMVTVRVTVQAAGEDPPQVAAGGVLNAASYSLQTPVAPGTIVSIFGSNLTDASGVLQAQGFPLPTELGGTSVTIGGEAVPPLVVSSGQINAMLPFDLAVNTSVPVVVTRHNAVSAPQPVSIVSSQPGMFTQSANGQGAGIVVIVHADGSQVVAGSANPAKAGDVLVIYCAGLGDVTPRLSAGTPAPPSPLSKTIDPVTVTIGGVNGAVFFAGPSPGFTGLYQVNATVPSGIAASQTAPLVLSQGGRASATVTIPIQ